jgi:hypothetical protein
LAKGFTKDGKFHPITDYKKGIRKSRDQKAKTQGMMIRKQRSIMFNMNDRVITTEQCFEDVLKGDKGKIIGFDKPRDLIVVEFDLHRGQEFFVPPSCIVQSERKARDRFGKSIKGKNVEIFGIKTIEQARAENEKIQNKSKLFSQKKSAIAEKIIKEEEQSKHKISALKIQEFELEKQTSEYFNTHPQWSLEGKFPEEEEIKSRITDVGNYLVYDDPTKGGMIYLVDGKWITIHIFYHGGDDPDFDNPYVKTTEVTVE